VHRLEVAAWLWRELMQSLRQRGRGLRESGAFLLGERLQLQSRSVLRNWVQYEDLDPACEEHEIIRLSTDAFPRLWDTCDRLKLQVIGDIHTHPGGPRQSESDRAHPMMAIAGHLALIAPHFALGEVKPRSVSLNVYQGKQKWRSYLGWRAARRITLK
jgi:proteasome lid subunit RPN8/RPN11